MIIILPYLRPYLADLRGGCGEVEGKGRGLFDWSSGHHLSIENNDCCYILYGELRDLFFFSKSIVPEKTEIKKQQLHSKMNI